MVPTLDSCRRYGDRAALLAIVPGLGHFRNRQYLIGTLTVATISVLLLWVFWLAILQFGSDHSNLGRPELVSFSGLWLSGRHRYSTPTIRPSDSDSRTALATQWISRCKSLRRA